MKARSLVMLAGLVAVVGCRQTNQTEEPAAPVVGWQQQSGGYSCYAPPDLNAAGRTDRRALRQEVLDSLMSQLRGEVDDSVQLDDETTNRFDFGFLAQPEKIDSWAVTIYQECVSAGSASAYMSYLRTVPEAVRAGECSNPFMFELHEIFDIGQGWQLRYHVCEGDHLLFNLTEDTAYRVEDGEDNWIDVMGDQNRTAGEDGPCADCAYGAIIMRFQPEDGGEETMQVMGYELDWEAPAHGYISFTVNDNVYYDNKFRERNGVIDYIALDIYTVE